MTSHPSHNNDKKLKEVFEEYYQRLCFFAQKMIGDKMAAEDIVSDVLVKYNKHQDKIAEEAIMSWLYTSVKNACVNFLKNISRRREILDDISYTSDKVEETFEARMIEAEFYNKIYRAIEELPEREKKIIKMFLEGHSGYEIASEIGCGHDHVRVYRSRAVEFIRNELNGTNKPKAAFIPKDIPLAPRSPKIYLLDKTGKKILGEYASLKEAGHYNGVSRKAVSQSAFRSKISKSHHKPFFMYIRDYNKLNGISQ